MCTAAATALPCSLSPLPFPLCLFGRPIYTTGPAPSVVPITLTSGTTGAYHIIGIKGDSSEFAAVGACTPARC